MKTTTTMFKVFLVLLVVLTIATSVRCYGLICATEVPTTATLLTTNITDADGVITLDNLGFTPGAYVWLSENNVPLTIESGTMNIFLNGTGCKVGDNRYYDSIVDYWDGTHYWSGLDTKPQFYIQGNGIDFICSLTFNPPISKFSAFVSSFEAVTGAIFIYDKSGNPIDCSYNVPKPNNGVNGYTLRGFESDTPIHTVSFSYGYITADSIQYKRFCAGAYDPELDACAPPKTYCLPNNSLCLYPGSTCVNGTQGAECTCPEGYTGDAMLEDGCEAIPVAPVAAPTLAPTQANPVASSPGTPIAKTSAAIRVVIGNIVLLGSVAALF